MEQLVALEIQLLSHILATYPAQLQIYLKDKDCDRLVIDNIAFLVEYN